MSKFYLQNERFIVEVEGYNGSSITGLRMKRNNVDPDFDVLGWTDWIEFEDVNLDPLNEWDGGYIGSHETKFVGFTVDTPGAYQGMNLIVFAPDPVPQDQTITTDIMLLTSDWNMFEQTYFLSTESVSEANFHLEGQWSFDSDGSPTIGSDTFTLANGTTFASDSGRDAAYFPNANSMMYASPKISLGSEYTISVWFKDLKDSGSSHAGWLNFDGYAANGVDGASGTGNRHNISVNPSNYLGAYDGSNFLSSGHEMTQVLYNGTGWHHLVATYDGTSIRYYINGSQVGNTVTFDGVDGIQIINGWSNYARTFASYLDDLRVYSTALSTDQVDALYDSTTVTLPAADPSISIELPANQLYGESFIQNINLEGASEHSVSWQYNGPEGWTSISDVNADKLVPWQYELYDVRALLIVNEVPYASNVVSPSEFLPHYYWDTDVTAASLGDTLTLVVDMKGYQSSAFAPIDEIYLSSFASSEFDDAQFGGNFTYVSGDVDSVMIYTIELNAELHQRYISPTVRILGNENIGPFYALGKIGTHHDPSVMTPDLSGDLVPLQKYGYKPLFLTEAEAIIFPGSSGTVHAHSLGGVTYYMSNGLNMDPNNGPITQWHGTWGLFMQHDGDDEVADVGTTPATYTNVSSATVAGRTAWSYAGQDSYVSFESDRPDLSGDWTISMWFNGLSSVEDYRTAARCYGVDHPILLMPDGRLGTWESSNTTFHDSGATLDPSSLSGWNHIVAVGSGTSTVFYVNGVSVGTSSYKTSDSLYSVGNHVFADGQPNSAVSGNQLWADHISGVKVYSRAIDSEEVQYWYAEEYVADPDGPQTLSVEQFDSYGDGWNGGELVVSDADGNVVGTFIGPANGVKLPAGLTESMTLANDALYSYVLTLGSYPTEITWNIKDSSGATLVSWSNSDSATGTFTLGTPPLYPGMTGNYYASTDAGTIVFENLQSNEDGITAGATQWAYSLSPLGEVGQAHGGTAVDFGNLTLTGLPESSSLTLYYGLIDAYGVVIWKSSLAENTLAKIQHTLTMWDSFGDGWDGTYFEIYDSNGATVFSTTRPVATFDNDGDGDIDTEDGKYPWWHYVNLTEGDYTWALVGGAYPGEHSFTFVRTSDDLSLAASTASDVTSGSFTVSAVSVDSTTPVITLLGDSPMTLTVGDSYVEPGATAVDDVDGALEVTISGHENIALSDDWSAYSGYNMSAPTIEGELLISGGSYGHNYLARKENDILPQTDFEIVVEFEDVTLPWAQYEPELRLRVDFLENAYSAEIKMQAYSAWGASNTFFSGFRQQHNSGQTYSGQTSGGSLVQTGAFKVVREGSTVTMYRREGSEGEFVQMSSATSANYAGAARIIVGFMNTPGRITSVSRTDIQTGAILGDYTVSYSATDAAGNTATVNRSVSVVSGAYVWHHNGLLTDIVKYLNGYDGDGLRSHMYLKNDGGNTTLYFTTDLLTWESFSAYDHNDTTIQGAPICAAYGPNGKVLMGTSTGHLYLISLGSNSLPESFTLLHETGHQINQIHFNLTSDSWLVAFDEKVHTMPAAGGSLSLRMSIPSGSVVIDFAAADDATSVIVRKSDFTFATFIAMPGWAQVHDETAMRAVFTSLGVTNVDYNYEHDMWTASDSDGETVIVTDQIVDWLLSQTT